MSSKWTNFEVNEVEIEEKKNIEVPSVPPGSRTGIKLEFHKPNRWGFALKQVIRQACKKFPEYFLPLANSFEVTTLEGKKVVIDTLGKWAFGAPGWASRLLFEGGERKKIVIYLPKNAPKELISLLQKAVEAL